MMYSMCLMNSPRREAWEDGNVPHTASTAAEGLIQQAPVKWRLRMFTGRSNVSTKFEPLDTVLKDRRRPISRVRR